MAALRDAGGKNCQNVGAEDSPTYLLGSADVDATMRVSVTARNQAGSSSATSTLTNVVGLASDPVAAAVGDIACPPGSTVTSGNCQQAATASLAQAQNPNATLVLGDNQYDSGALSEYQGANGYDATWGVFGCAQTSLCPNTPSVHPVPGNHEYGTSNATGYFANFGNPIANPANTQGPGTAEGGYYSA